MEVFVFKLKSHVQYAVSRYMYTGKCVFMHDVNLKCCQVFLQ